MKQQKIKAGDRPINNRQLTLLELLDRLLDKGAVVKGEVLLSVADIDLVYLNVGLLLSSVKSIAEANGKEHNKEAELLSWSTAIREDFLDEPQLEVERKDVAPASSVKENTPRKSCNEEILASVLSSTIDYEPNQRIAPKTNVDPDNVEKGLVKLVLTLVDLIRKLMEKQAIRRLEAGQLNVEEIEKMGHTFLLLDERMGQIKKTFGLKDEDLNLDLGPLGKLI
jgi:Gas vesicle protein K/Gas vesicle protein